MAPGAVVSPGLDKNGNDGTEKLNIPALTAGLPVTAKADVAKRLVRSVIQNSDRIELELVSDLSIDLIWFFTPFFGEATNNGLLRTT